MKSQRGSVMITLAIFVAIAALIGFYVLGKYNSFVSNEESIDGSWAQIENQLQRRFDLIPNLVNTVKGYMDHEEDIFLKLAEARTQYGSANSIEEVAAANDELSNALSNLFIIVENYPPLQSSPQFIRLMDELAGTENRIAVARQDYNENVRAFNSSVRRMPGSVIANMFGFEQKTYFEVAPGIDQIPTVNFGSDS